MRRYLEGKQRDVDLNRNVIRMAAELLTSQLKFVVTGSPGSVARKRSLARGFARKFDQAVRDARYLYRELCEAQATLEELRGGPEEQASIARRDEIEQRFLDAFSEVMSLPVEEGKEASPGSAWNFEGNGQR
jgi:hypothetical protein